MKKTSLLTAILVLVSLGASAQKWAGKSIFMGASKQGAVSFTIGNKAYVGAGKGIANAYFKDLWEYDPKTDTYTQKADLPVSTYTAFSFAIGNKGYVGCGEFGTGTTPNFWEYDPASDTWTAKASFTTQLLKGASGFTIGNKGYVVGGELAGTCSNALWQYNPSTDSWSAKAPYTINTRMNASCFVIGSKAYYGLGGQNSTAQYSDFSAYDTITKSWSTVANFPASTPRMAASSFAINGYGYVVGGLDNSSTAHGDNWQYNPSNNTWAASLDIFFSSVRYFAATFVIGNRAYITCGFTTPSSWTQNTYQFNPCNLSINGNVIYSAGALNGTTANTRAMLYSYKSNTKMPKVDSVQLTTIGAYSFNNLDSDTYIVRIEADKVVYPNLVTTYAGDSLSWDGAFQFSGACGASITKNITMIETTTLTGKGKISGTIVEGKGYKSGKTKTVGEPIQSVDISVGRKPKGKGLIVAHTKTDINGNYVFNNMPIGDYEIFVEIAGLPMDSSYNFSVTTKDTIFKSFDYVADSVKIHKENNFTGIKEIGNIGTTNVYPNPFSGQTSATVYLNENCQVEISIYNLLGEKISTIENKFLSNGDYKYDVIVNQKGIYLLVINAGGNISTAKIISE